MSYDKVFGIGLNKTGTTTLGDMLGQMGMRHCSWDPVNFQTYRAGNFRSLFRRTSGFDSFTDWPWPLMVEQLLDHFGERARFVLTRRPTPEIWVESLKGHALNTPPGCSPRADVFGYEYPHENIEAHLQFYRAHITSVRQLFAKRGQRHLLLEMCWEEGSSWVDLGHFLSRPIPRHRIPHHNDSRLRRPVTGIQIANRTRIAALTDRQWRTA